MIFEVSTLVRYMKGKLEGDANLKNIEVNGEITNFKRSASGHFYFTLKDAFASVSCTLFSSRSRFMTFMPKNGDKVTVKGNISIYETSGSLQLLVQSIQKQGLGELFQKYLELKEALQKEGLFDEDHKTVYSLKYPERVAVLCGENSAALSDVSRVFSNRWPLCDLDVYPVLVQGENAPAVISKRLKDIDPMGYDAIILTRGGGSFEELFCFNDESLVRTIYDMKTYIVVAIGHEQDFTLAEFAADHRASNPTAAVVHLTPDILDEIYSLDQLVAHMDRSIDKKIREKSRELQFYINTPVLKDPYVIIRQKADQIAFYIEKIKKLSMRFDLIRNEIFTYESQINHSVKEKAIKEDLKISTLKNEIPFLIKQKLLQNASLIDSYQQRLKVYSIDEMLQKGYSLIYKNDHILNSSVNLYEEDLINIRLSDGEVKAIVKETKHDI